nr:MAG TPA: hypothetical protein [Bacteriophage sp.]
MLLSGFGVRVCSFPFRGLSFLFHPCIFVQFRPVCVVTPCKLSDYTGGVACRLFGFVYPFPSSPFPCLYSITSSPCRQPV